MTVGEAIAALAAGWPRWQFWTVHQYIGAPVFCARRHDDHRVVLNAASPAELAEMLEAAAEAKPE